MNIATVLGKVLSSFTHKNDQMKRRILLALDHLGPRATSLEIRDHLEADGRGIDRAWFDTALGRLEEDGYLLSIDEEGAEQEADCFSVRMYILTEQGKARVKALKESEEAKGEQ